MSRKITSSVVALALMLSACSDAQKSTEVTSAYVSSANYSSMSCNSLRAEADRLRKSVPELEAAVDKEYKKDKNMEAVTWILFWPAVFAMDGNDAEAQKLANAKGEAEAIRSAMQSKGCRF